MPIWKPKEIWKGQDAFIIGGGPSLRKFDWELLKPELTIGCNTAYTLGEEVCKLCVFGDRTWYNAHQVPLSKYKGIVFTNCVSLLNAKEPWLWTMPRQAAGLHTNALGWNENTGAAAINLALILGAKRIFLLGYDMRRTTENSNWHNQIINEAQVKPKVYLLFAKAFKRVVKAWQDKFPDREIINVTYSSALDPENYFPWADPDVFWEERKTVKV